MAEADQMLFSQELKKFARNLGVEIRRYNVVQSMEARYFVLLRHHDIDLVLDVGANEGQYGKLLRRGGYTRRILSFEPLQAAHKKLTLAAELDSSWAVASRMAIGALDGEIKINVSGNSTSSSILGMRNTHTQAAPQSRYINSETVLIRRMDSINHTFMDDAKNIFLKIDTQGYEAKVLDGADSLLGRVKGIQIELSLVELYEGQSLYVELIQRLLDRGFNLWGVFPGFVDPANGRLMQFDGLFFRE